MSSSTDIGESFFAKNAVFNGIIIVAIISLFQDKKRAEENDCTYPKKYRKNLVCLLV